tara:strand:- start:589 stop:1968 length:1380 start_codon:yes stop_codon:yes gene_type:complete
MRPLNRPMFRYGGPIKEGIMDGMQNKKAALVGDPVFPKAEDGRAKHNAAYVAAGLYNAGKLALQRGISQAPNFLRNVKAGFKTPTTFTPATEGIMSKLPNFVQKYMLPSSRFRNSGSKIPLGGRNPNNLPVPFGSTMDATGKLSYLQALKDPRKLGMAIRENPGLALSTPSLAYSAAEIGGPVVGSTLKGIANFLVPGTKFDPFGPDEPKVTGGDTKLERTDKITTVPNDGTGAVQTPKTEEEKAKINEDRINETREKYYKLMGIDKMNKKAAYNSLIDASKIVSEEGGDLKGSIQSGNLQNRIISAISKNLDSSADLKKQINAAILKGEIEKDIKQSDPANEVLNELRLLQARKLTKELDGTSVADMIAATSAKSGAGTVTSDIVTEFIRSKGTDALTLPDDKFQKWERNENNKGKDEIDYFQENYSGLDDGIYVVNKRAVEKKGNQIAFVDLDEIMG